MSDTEKYLLSTEEIEKQVKEDSAYDFIRFDRGHWEDAIPIIQRIVLAYAEPLIRADERILIREAVKKVENSYLYLQREGFEQARKSFLNLVE